VTAAGGGPIGVLGGAFNPPHLGHLLLGRTARDQLGLERVLLMTTGQAPHKRIEDDPGAPLRLEMTRRAAEGEEGIEASSLEVEREGPSYTADTLELLGDRHPGVGLVFLMGADVAAGLEGWHDPRRVIELASLGIAPRAAGGLEPARAALERLGTADRVAIIRMPECEVSSSMVRERAAAGGSLDGLVPAGVAKLIEERGLYR
jgi:nicotinate-nucleotide adenylyltransferase